MLVDLESWKGIEDNSMDFCIGVQWHPEFLIEKNDETFLQYFINKAEKNAESCLLYTSPSPRDATLSRMPSSA